MRKSLNELFTTFEMDSSDEWSFKIDQITDLIYRDGSLRELQDLLGCNCTLEKAYQFAALFTEEFIGSKLGEIAPSMVEERKRLSVPLYDDWRSKKEAKRRAQVEAERLQDINLFQLELRAEKSAYIS